MKNKYLIAVIFFLLTFAIRIYRLDQRFNFNAEYNYKLWPIKEIVYDHKVRLIGIEAVSYIHHLHYPPLALYLFAPVFWVTRGNPISIEIALIVLSAVTSVILFFLTSKLINIKFGAVSALIYSLSFFIQHVDRFIWVVGPMLFFTTAYTSCIFLIEQYKKYLLLVLFAVGLLTGIALNFHFQAVSFIFSTMLYLFFINKNKSIKSYAIYLLGVLLPISPLLVFELRHNFYNSKGVIILFSNSQGVLKSSPLEALSNTLKAFTSLPIKILLPDFQINSFGVAATLFLLEVVAAYCIFKTVNKLPTTTRRFYGVLLILLSFGALSFPFVQNSFYRTDYYLFYLVQVFVIFIASLSLFIKKARYIMTLILVLTIFLIVNINKSINEKVTPAWKDQKSAVSYVIQNAPAQDFEIRFNNTRSEEYAFLFYYLSRKFSYPYDQIHFLEPWHQDGKPYFIFSQGQPVTGAQKFGEIYVSKNNSI